MTGLSAGARGCGPSGRSHGRGQEGYGGQPTALSPAQPLPAAPAAQRGPDGSQNQTPQENLPLMERSFPNLRLEAVASFQLE